MPSGVLVTDRDQAIANILRYRTELDDPRRGAGLRKLMSRVHAWYAARPDGGQWHFAPSKFVGYPDNSAKAYFSEKQVRDGRQTERVLRQWFHAVEPGTRQADLLDRELRNFLSGYGHPAPRKGARISVPAEILGPIADAPESSARIASIRRSAPGARISGEPGSGSPTSCSFWRPARRRPKFSTTTPISKKRI